MVGINLGYSNLLDWPDDRPSERLWTVVPFSVTGFLALKTQLNQQDIDITWPLNNPPVYNQRPTSYLYAVNEQSFAVLPERTESRNGVRVDSVQEIATSYFRDGRENLTRNVTESFARKSDGTGFDTYIESTKSLVYANGVPTQELVNGATYQADRIDGVSQLTNSPEQLVSSIGPATNDLDAIDFSTPTPATASTAEAQFTVLVKNPIAEAALGEPVRSRSPIDSQYIYDLSVAREVGFNAIKDATWQANAVQRTGMIPCPLFFSGQALRIRDGKGNTRIARVRTAPVAEKMSLSLEYVN